MDSSPLSATITNAIYLGNDDTTLATYSDLALKVQDGKLSVTGKFMDDGSALTVGEFNFEIYKKTGDGGIDANLFGKTVEIKTSEWTRMPKDYEYCLCGEFNNGYRHHLIAFPDYFAQGKSISFF